MSGRSCWPSLERRNGRRTADRGARSDRPRPPSLLRGQPIAHAWLREQIARSGGVAFPACGGVARRRRGGTGPGRSDWGPRPRVQTIAAASGACPAWRISVAGASAIRSAVDIGAAVPASSTCPPAHRQRAGPPTDRRSTTPDRSRPRAACRRATRIRASSSPTPNGLLSDSHGQPASPRPTARNHGSTTTARASAQSKLGAADRSNRLPRWLPSTPPCSPRKTIPKANLTQHKHQYPLNMNTKATTGKETPSPFGLGTARMGNSP